MLVRPARWIAAGGLLAATALVGAATRALPVAATDGGGSSPTFAASSSGPVTLSATLDRGAVQQGEEGVVRVELVLAAAEDEIAARRATDLVIVLDRSGSMAGEKMEHARAAVRELVGELGARDRFALVAYSDAAMLAIPFAEAAARRASDWGATLAAIAPAGGTNMSSGLDLAFDLVDHARSGDRVPRVILLSDGLANQGDWSPEGLRQRARRAARGEYALSTVGVGADFNEYLMSSLADAGTGNYYYVADPRELARVFEREFGAASATVASALAVEIAPAAGVRVVDAAGYPLETERGRIVFRPGSLFAGQERRVWVTFDVDTGTAGEREIGEIAVAYTLDGERARLALAETPRVACVETEERFYSSVDVDAWTRSVLVDEYNKMQQEVAREVKEGDRDEALGRLEAFRAKTAAMNAKIESAPVAEKLDRLADLEAEVAAAFEGEGQERRQNELSKKASAQALDGRRAGSK